MHSPQPCTQPLFPADRAGQLASLSALTSNGMGGAEPIDVVDGRDIASIDVDTAGAIDVTDESCEWSEDDIVQLHWRLLQEIRQLAEPATPLEEKLDTLRWVFTEREKDDRPFSFASCLRVVGCSPLSPIAFCGLVDADEVRERIRLGLKPWLRATLAHYPLWVREALSTNPEWIEARLARNPQWINEQLKQMSTVGDLFD